MVLEGVRPKGGPLLLLLRRRMERDGRDRPARQRRAGDLSGRVQVPGRGRYQPVGRRERPGNISCHDAPKTLPYILKTAALRRPRDETHETSHRHICGRHGSEEQARAPDRGPSSWTTTATKVAWTT